MKVGMKILVTGGGGFIGTYVVGELLSSGNDEIVVFDCNESKTLPKALLDSSLLEKITWEIGDIVSSKALQRVIKKHQIQKVVHLAYLLMEQSEKNPSQAIRVNCEGTYNVFETCRKAKVEKVVWGSSIAVYGSPEEYQDEIISSNALFKPSSIYGVCKAFNEFLALYYQKKGLNSIGLRFCLAYGPGRSLIKGSSSNFITDLIEKPVFSNEWVSIPYGDDAVNYLYIEDAARAVTLALREESKKGIYTICGDYRPIRDVAAYVKKIVNHANIRLQPGSFGLCQRYDMKPAFEGIGYFPKYSMEDGVTKYIDFLKQKESILLIEK
jgi:nucleoside-diphosphate-sugar epimerase